MRRYGLTMLMTTNDRRRILERMGNFELHHDKDSLSKKDKGYWRAEINVTPLNSSYGLQWFYYIGDTQEKAIHGLYDAMKKQLWEKCTEGK